MRTLLLAFFLFSFASFSNANFDVKVLEDTTSKIKMEMTASHPLQHVKKMKGESYTALSIEGLSQSPIEGAPLLPVWGRMIAVPSSRYDTDI